MIKIRFTTLVHQCYSLTDMMNQMLCGKVNKSYLGQFCKLVYKPLLHTVFVRYGNRNFLP